MKIVVIGAGYVGLVSAACFASGGHTVTCVENDQDKLALLRQGITPIWEPGLEQLIQSNAQQQRLTFTDSIAEAIQGAEAVFIAVGTPETKDGSADLSAIFSVAQTIAQQATHSFLVVIKSTVPVGTGQKVNAQIRGVLSALHREFELPVCANPEFLREGTAIQDFRAGDRIIIGVHNEREEAVLREIYRPFNRIGDKFLVMDVPSAELSKYGANAMLALRISFMNELAALAEATGANIEQVRRGIGADSRIGQHFLYPGAGYGGSCFPKDVRALAHTAGQYEQPATILEAISTVNNRQKTKLLEKLTELLAQHYPQQTPEETSIAIWGLAFKPNTDDVREAPALQLVTALLDAGYNVIAYDPAAKQSFQKALAATTLPAVALSKITYAESAAQAVLNATALVICTEWAEFRTFPGQLLAEKMHGRLIVDGRNVYPTELPPEFGFMYASIGRRTSHPENTSQE